MNGCGRQVGALRSCDVAMDVNVIPGRKVYVREEKLIPSLVADLFCFVDRKGRCGSVKNVKGVLSFVQGQLQGI